MTTCGDDCELCEMRDDTPLCISCNKTNLKTSIDSIITYISEFYSISSLDIRYLENFNTNKTDCFLCPLGCFGCEGGSISSNPFDLYAAKCYRCRSVSSLGSMIIMNYDWKFDPDTNTCTLC